MEDGCHMLGPHSMHSAVQVDFSQQAACCVDSASIRQRHSCSTLPAV